MIKRNLRWYFWYWVHSATGNLSNVLIDINMIAMRKLIERTPDAVAQR